MAKEITELLQEAGEAGDSSIGLDSGLGLVRRDLVPYDKDAAAVDSSGTDLFIGVSVSGDARTFNAIPYIKGDTAATPVVDDLVVGVGNDGSAKQFTVASLATTLEGESFGTGAFTNVGTVATLDTGTGAGEVPTNGDLGNAATADGIDIIDIDLSTGSPTSYDLNSAPGGYPGDGVYLIRAADSGSEASTDPLFTITVKSGKYTISNAIITTTTFRQVYCSNSGVLTANELAFAGGTTSFDIIEIYKLALQ